MGTRPVGQRTRGAWSGTGFTVIEVVVLVLLLMVLALVVLPKYWGTQTAARRSARAATVAAINTAVAVYQRRHNGACPGQAGQETFRAFLGDAAYFPNGAPVDPETNDASTFIATYSATTCRTR